MGNDSSTHEEAIYKSRLYLVRFMIIACKNDFYTGLEDSVPEDEL